MASMAGETILDSIKRPLSSAPNSNPSSWLSDEQLSMLHFLFSKNLERALRILDQKGVYRIVGEPSKRVVFQCKHQLAARIGDALEICEQVILSDEELAILLLQ